MTAQYDIHIVVLDPTLGAEMTKTRPCLVISPDPMNKHLKTVQIAPLTTNTQPYPWRVPIRAIGKAGMVALEQIRTVDQRRLLRKVGRASPSAIQAVKAALHEMLVA